MAVLGVLPAPDALRGEPAAAAGTAGLQAALFDELKGRIRVSEVVGRKVKLTRRGREFVGLSPFSNEKSPSFTVHDDTQFYHFFPSA